MKVDQTPSLEKAKACPPGSVFVEIGTWEGDFSYELLTQTSCAKLYCVDPYKHFDADGYKDGMNTLSQNEFDKKYEKTKDRFKRFGDRVEFLRMTSKEAVKRFEDLSIEYIYVDGNHDYPYVEEDIRLWYPKVKKGGYLCGDDVYSQDPSEHDANNNVLRIWSRDAYGVPNCWGQYGTYMACKKNEETYGIKFQFEQTQCSVKKL